MKKETYFKDLRAIQTLANKVRTLNESLAFADEYDEPEDMQEMPMQQEMPQQEEMPMGQEEEQDPEEMVMQNSGAIEQIREIALKGMVELSKQTENPEYEVLKKIFLMVDKANDKKNEDEKK